MQDVGECKNNAQGLFFGPERPSGARCSRRGSNMRSPASSLSVARLLTAVLPRVEVIEFEGLGHMAPLTHPHVVNAAITEFLARG